MKLSEIYTAAELDDEDELLYHHASEEALTFDFTVKVLTASDIAELTAADGMSRVVDVFEDHAEDAQRNLVDEKMAQFDADRVIVISGDDLVDGYHHAIAAWMLGCEVRCIDLAEAVAPDDLQPS